MKNVIITTEQRGVWFAQVEEGKDLTPKTLTGLRNCKMAIYWGTERGLQQLAQSGPTKDSRISEPCDIDVLHNVTAVFAVTDNAAEVWMRS